MLAGLLELLPWIKQWHNEPSAEYGGLRMGEYFEQFLDGECRQHGLTRDDLRAWRPAKKTRAGSKRKQVEAVEAPVKPKKARGKKKAAAVVASPAETEAE